MICGGAPTINANHRKQLNPVLLARASITVYRLVAHPSPASLIRENHSPIVRGKKTQKVGLTGMLVPQGGL